MHVRALQQRLARVAARAVARLLVRLGSRGLPEHARRLPSRRAESRPAGLEVFCFVTDETQYAELLASFAAGGLGPPHVRFTALRDRRSPDGADPYAFISAVGARSDRPDVLLVHQDVRLDQGAGADELEAALARLDEVDPGWVVAGNAGGTRELGVVRRLRDPHGGSTGHELPARVDTLDENFLLFNHARVPRCTPGLDGFHFYGSDVALNALVDGGAAYVLDFPVIHLSPGRRGPDYELARARFERVWAERLRFALVRAPTEILFVVRSPLLRRFVASNRVRRWVWAWGRRAPAARLRSGA